MTFEGKIAILPCTGVGQVVGTITRQTAYRVCEDERPEHTVLVCLPALIKGVREDIDMVRECPVVVVEGCRECCAAHALAAQEVTPAATVSVPDVMKGKGFKVKREARRRLTAAETAVVELTVEAVVTQVDRLRRETRP
ncbi:MAG TPA: putative zinc-binding protein [Planctomycetota bacterium]|nr:putative zinc-binding protein [Planctomycetota bacterium]